MQPEQNPYQFITESPKQAKRPLLPGGNSQKGRIIIVAGGLLVLIIIAVVIMSIISAASNAGKADLIKTAQKQAELIRVSKLGMDRAKGTSAKNLATTTYVSLLSDQAALSASLKGTGVKLNSKTLAPGKDQKTDALLTAGEQANRFDEVLTETLQKELVEYQRSLKVAYDNNDSKKLRATLQAQFNNAGMLATAKQ